MLSLFSKCREMHTCVKKDVIMAVLHKPQEYGAPIPEEAEKIDIVRKIVFS